MSSGKNESSQEQSGSKVCEFNVEDNLFGNLFSNQSQSSQAQGGGLFGNLVNSAGSEQQKISLFGNNEPKSSQSSGLFGNENKAEPQLGGLFAQSQNTP